MLVRFKVKNYLSFNDEVTFAMFRGESNNHYDHVYRTNENQADILKSSIIYGANASGKTNLIKAIDDSRSYILNGSSNDDRIGIKKYKFNDSNVTSFEYIINTSGYEYIYGFDISPFRVEKEWCYRINNKKVNSIYYREFNDAKDSMHTTVNETLIENSRETEYLHFSADACRTTELLLTRLNNQNKKYLNKEISEIIEWFKNLNVLHTDIDNSNFFKLVFDEDFYKEYRGILELLDIDIDVINAQDVGIEFVKNEIPSTVINSITSKLTRNSSTMFISGSNNFYIFSLDKDNDIVVRKVMIGREDENGKMVYFDIQEESEGTRRLFNIIPMLIEFKKHKSVFIIDEIDKSMHTLLTRALFQIFFYYTKGTSSQLIATTHDTNLMDQSLFRDDEIWYMKKNFFRESELYSLSEFKEIADDELISDYLDGRLGAIPEINLKENQ